MSTRPVLIVGAGPTGLVLALALSRLRIPIRIIDASSGPSEQSRALLVHARTLEFYRQFGIADEATREGIPFTSFRVRSPGLWGYGPAVVRSLETNDQDLSPFPFVLSYPQDYNERLLIRHLEAFGVEVERSTSIASFVQQDGNVVAELDGPGGVEKADFSYVCGCDGAHSAVRKILKIPFVGTTYSELFYVADVRMDRNFDHNIYINLGVSGHAMMLPVRTTGMHRLGGGIPPEHSGKQHFDFEAVRNHVEALVGGKVLQVNWATRYQLHQRVAAQFHAGRAFLLGDAGHVHSPVGGQGMNTGIGDAVNLAWKLASVHSGHADPVLLDSYEKERMPFARRLASTTDRVFKFANGVGLLGRIARLLILPLLAVLVSRLSFVRKIWFRTVSQIAIHYRDSPISYGKVGMLAAGDRMPWVSFKKSDNYEQLDGVKWLLHVYGNATIELEHLTWLKVQRFPFTKRAKRAGLKEDAVYILRPDGYIGSCLPNFDLVGIQEYFYRLGITEK